MSNLKYKPKGDTIGVPGKGFIKAEAFSQEDLNAMIERAKNRKVDVHAFLVGCGLVAVAQPELFVETEPVKKEAEVKPEKKARKVKEVE